MPGRTLVVASRVGLHARPAAAFTRAAAASGVPVRLRVEMSAEGEGCEEDLDRLAALLAHRAS